MYRQAKFSEPLLREKSVSKRVGYSLPEPLGEPVTIPHSLVRKELPLPELSEVDVVRHFTRLSEMNFGVDTGTYPLGSCTMKYNPKITEELSTLFSGFHPLQDESTIQGCLEVLYNLQEYLKLISGTAAVTLQPAAGAGGELTGALIIKACQKGRTEMVVPDSAHGTNPASAHMAGFDVVEIPSNDQGTVDLEALKSAVSEKTAGLMLTNPNTLGIFEKDILQVADIVHDAGGLLYYDGANLNAIAGICRPGDMGFDIVHFNLHKTFSTPHGGGGPGSGPVGVCEKLKSYLPVPLIGFNGKDYSFDYDLPNTIGKVHGFYGNFQVAVKAYIYAVIMGSDIRTASQMAVLNANYLAENLKDHYEMPYQPLRKHEIVLSCEKIKRETDCRALDIAKRLLDYGIHAPTIYFPLIVHEALMIEPTESESKEDLDTFIEVMIKIKNECYTTPDIVKEAPHNTAVGRLDEVKAARNPVLAWNQI
ncbi:MAG: aminomethyl-transferring glycine dehydrogenase subunit GcvPB [Theionarchaea archaeon]|nr:aminomethyl-transferring glycine dehydrogenase subunit GcvPB [Theionarchaea archaeon]MBU7001383.1 aminomethyl-transferring glycine dehydrogenase subunit GcvPB [Theionarchaea archaeon]MBU7035769.1 aminomethyl-transferring glycine dehydrogenase subunit GcvPB [Theionarchaea archaeon]